MVKKTKKLPGWWLCEDTLSCGSAMVALKSKNQNLPLWCGGGGGGGVVYLTDYRTTPVCSTLFYSVQLWIVAIDSYTFTVQSLETQSPENI